MQTKAINSQLRAKENEKIHHRRTSKVQSAQLAVKLENLKGFKFFSQMIYLALDNCSQYISFEFGPIDL